jgi:hypothetical protein
VRSTPGTVLTVTASIHWLAADHPDAAVSARRQRAPKALQFPDDMGICRIVAEPDRLMLTIEARTPRAWPGCRRSSAGWSTGSAAEKKSNWNGDWSHEFAARRSRA